MQHPQGVTSHLNQVLTITLFLLIVGQLAELRELELRGILLFVAPVLVAFFMSSHPKDPGGRAVANSFLATLSLGLIVARYPWLMPALGGIEKNLPPVADRTLAWYVGVYLVFFTIVIPINAARRQLERHRMGEPITLSPPVCWLILSVGVPMGVGVSLVSLSFLGFVPLR